MPQILVILAGGASRRMNGENKALLKLGGERLVDRAIRRLTPQATEIILSAPGDFGTGLSAIADEERAPPGPAGALYSIQRWLQTNRPGAKGFFTSPVDGPFAPNDLVKRLAEHDGAATASDGAYEHPTFAYWPCDQLEEVFLALEKQMSVSLKALGESCGAQHIIWRDKKLFFNINAPEDLACANEIIDAC